MTIAISKKRIESAINALQYELRQHSHIDEYPLPAEKGKVDTRYYELSGEIKALRDILEGKYAHLNREERPS